MRTENSEISASLQQAMDAANKYKSQINVGAGQRAELDRENEHPREVMRQEESAMQAGILPQLHSYQQGRTDPDVERSSTTIVRKRI